MVASYNHYGASEEDGWSSYFPVHKHFSTPTLVILCHASSAMVVLLVLSPHDLVFVTLEKYREMDKYIHVEGNMPIIFL